MKHSYETSGTCAKTIEFELGEDDIVTNVKFVGGCAGNTVAVSKLVEGMNRKEVIEKLKGIGCRGRQTSCPDQLATALENVQKGQNL